jgi:predicted acetyltransferase
MGLKLDIYRASVDEQHIIANLLQLYIYEFSALLGIDVERDGRFPWDGLEEYWDDKSLHPYLFKANTKLAGFALIQRTSVVTGDPNVWDMEDFFVVEKYRRSGVGSAVISHLFREFVGPWEVRVLEGNDRALEFWRHVISVQCATAVQPVPTLINGRTFGVFSFETS